MQDPTTASPETWHRAALLMEVGRPKALARRLAQPDLLAAPDADALARCRQALAERDLWPWVPPGEVVPLLLVRGRLPSAPGIAVVGTRSTDPYGLACAARVARDAVDLGRSVVSGGAEGCDAAAHRAALDRGGHTVVLLGFGHDTTYPAIHRGLFEEIVASGGALVSPWWPTVRPARHQFLARNRLIAALSEVVVVVRARARSGALSTAKAALQLGRTLMAVPGGVGEALSLGPNQLLAEGARALTGPGALAAALGTKAPRGLRTWPTRDLGEAAPWRTEASSEPSTRFDPAPDARRVLDILCNDGSLDLDALLGQTGLGVDTLLAALTDLEVAGLVEQVPGQRYAARTSVRPLAEQG